ncbi:hypothetical protein [Sphingomonas aracearum]|uniref:Uncharacterized protein n=1 Tax=Sphingomonas aracearum TaxID=2283317 RepID=A0A369VUU4_9SPHN|nr:hypothetical protein [Sphingomonas aracearum]RDE04960.1 hypothetical protein DVW87_15475 [Sphingomonas aracearum]
MAGKKTITPVIINADRDPTPGNPHSWLPLIGDPPGSEGTRILYGVLRPSYRGWTNTAVQFAQVKLAPVPTPDGEPWAVTAMRDTLRAGATTFVHLDAAQLVKHAFGLVTEGRRLGKVPVLFYLYAEPERRGSVVVSPEALQRHRAEIADFAIAVAGAEVRFAACSWREWLVGWRHMGAILYGEFTRLRWRRIDPPALARLENPAATALDADALLSGEDIDEVWGLSPDQCVLLAGHDVVDAPENNILTLPTALLGQQLSLPSDGIWFIGVQHSAHCWAA